jgi:hypothetical protein
MAWSLNGCGTKFYGQRDYRADGSHVTTKWIVGFYIPLIPLRSLRVRYQGPGENRFPIGFGSTDSYAVYQKTFPNWRQVLCTYSLIGLYVGGLILMLDIGGHYFPHGLEGHPIAFLGLATAVVVPIFIPRILRYGARKKAGI